MCELERAIRRWWWQEMRRSSLSPRELDELEDHLRARVDLELELNARLTPARAFAIARDELGVGAALSREFAKAGKPRWRRLLVVGWALFAVSFILPTVSEPMSPFPDNMILSVTGWKAFRWALSGLAGPLGIVSACTNSLMLVTGLWVRRHRSRCPGWAVSAMAAVAAFNLLFWPVWVVAEGDLTLQAGYFAWASSFACTAAALWLRGREWASARLRRASI